MRRPSVLVAVSVAWLCATSAFAGGAGLPAPLAPFEAHYRVSNGIVTLGTATFRLGRDPGRDPERSSRVWRYRSILRAESIAALFVDGPMRETTWLKVHEGTLRPIVYHHQNGDEGVRVIFDWSEGEALVASDDDARHIEIEPGTRDQFSAILRVMSALAAGARTLTFPGIDDDGESERLHFEVTGEERVTVPLDSYDTVRVQRIHDSDRTTITWLAPALGWLPVKVEQHEDGELSARLELTSLERE